MTPSGIEPATFRFAVQYVNQLRHQQRAPVSLASRLAIQQYCDGHSFGIKLFGQEKPLTCSFHG